MRDVEVRDRQTTVLPPGAAAYARSADPQSTSARCVTDLIVDRVTFLDSACEINIDIELRHDCRRHVEDLVIGYVGVTHLDVKTHDFGSRWSTLEPVVLETLLPDPRGCRHELVCRSGSLTIVSRDLVASRQAAHCGSQDCVSGA